MDVSQGRLFHQEGRSKLRCQMTMEKYSIVSPSSSGRAPICDSFGLMSKTLISEPCKLSCLFFSMLQTQKLHCLQLFFQGKYKRCRNGGKSESTIKVIIKQVHIHNTHPETHIYIEITLIDNSKESSSSF